MTIIGFEYQNRMDENEIFETNTITQQAAVQCVKKIPTQHVL